MIRPRDEPPGADPNERPRVRPRFELFLEESVLDDLLGLDNMNVAHHEVFALLDAPSLARLQLVLLMRSEMPGHLTLPALRERLALVWEQLLYRDHAPTFPSNDTAPRVDRLGVPLPASRIYAPKTCINHPLAQMFEVLRASGRPASLLLAQRAYAAGRLIMRLLAIMGDEVCSILPRFDMRSAPTQQRAMASIIAQPFGNRAANCIVPLAILQEFDAVPLNHHLVVVDYDELTNGRVASKALRDAGGIKGASVRNVRPHVFQRTTATITTLVPAGAETPFFKAVVAVIANTGIWDPAPLDDDDGADAIDWGAMMDDGNDILDDVPGNRSQPAELGAWPLPQVPPRPPEFPGLVAEQKPLHEAWDADTRFLFPRTVVNQQRADDPAVLLGQWQSPMTFYRVTPGRPRILAAGTVVTLSILPDIQPGDDENDFQVVLDRPVTMKQDFWHIEYATDPVILFHELLVGFAQNGPITHDPINLVVTIVLNVLRAKPLEAGWANRIKYILRDRLATDTVIHRLLRFALGMDADVLGFAHFLEHANDVTDLLYGLSVESTHTRPKLKFFDRRCGLCAVAERVSHVIPTEAPLFLCPACSGLSC